MQKKKEGTPPKKKKKVCSAKSSLCPPEWLVDDRKSNLHLSPLLRVLDTVPGNGGGWRVEGGGGGVDSRADFH